MTLSTEDKTPNRMDEITSAYVEISKSISAKLAKNQRVRRNLPGGGRLRMDRQLPFLCVHRETSDAPEKVTRELITTEAAYLFSSSDASCDQGLLHLVSNISSAMEEHFGTFLLFEIWADADLAVDFEIISADADAIPSAMQTLQTELASIVGNGRSAIVKCCEEDPAADFETYAGRHSLARALSSSSFTIGLAIKPYYFDQATGHIYPLVLQKLRQKLAIAIRKTVAEFTCGNKVVSPFHHETFGPSSLVKAARLVDRQLCEVSQSFDFLLQVTPTNSEQAWAGFRDSGFKQVPALHYRELPYHPNLLKRRLFAIEIERIEDATLAHLFWEKQNEIDRQLSALRDLHEGSMAECTQRSNFLSSSLQLYGGPEKSLVELSEKILKHFSAYKNDDQHEDDNQVDGANQHVKLLCIDAEKLIAYALREFEFYHARMSEFTAKVEISNAIASGIMVSRDTLLIADSIAISQQRVAPLLHHEIGTHLLTYFNGRCQPFQQLYVGLAGYDELQEGIAVLAEYMVGGLTPERIRVLAARVLAVHSMTQGKPFAEVFSQLHEDYNLSYRQSFTTALRVFRGGGLTKDIIYLRGLRDLLGYLADGHDIEPLYVGKIGLQHIPYIQEMRRRGIILPPKLLPRFWDDSTIRERLEDVRGKSVLDLMEID